MKSNKRNTKGFSLIELLIVVAIILIIAAIAIPNLLRSKMAANQASAVGSLRTINTAEVTYASTYNTGYSATLAYLGPPAAGSTTPTATTADLIDSVLSAGTKSGYVFAYSAATADASGNIDAYIVNADPVNAQTGQNHYFSDQSNVIRFNTAAAASSASSPIQ
jgi:type IV pilus assembly protein PilA